jgi:osmotically-inducible protein OsmY
MKQVPTLIAATLAAAVMMPLASAGPEASAGIAVAADTKSSTSQKLDDATLTAKVKSKLLADKGTSGLKINVDTKGGVVTLTGVVKTAAEKDLAGQLASATEGVASVNNSLTVTAN